MSALQRKVDVVCLLWVYPYCNERMTPTTATMALLMHARVRCSDSQTLLRRSILSPRRRSRRAGSCLGLVRSTPSKRNVIRSRYFDFICELIKFEKRPDPTIV